MTTRSPSNVVRKGEICWQPRSIRRFCYVDGGFSAVLRVGGAVWSGQDERITLI